MTAERVFVWTEGQLRPVEGWLPFGLLAGAVIVFVMGVLEANWVARDGVVVVTAAVGFGVMLLLAKRGRSAVWSWVLVTLYILGSTFLGLIRFSPWLLLWGWDTFATEVRSNWLAVALSFLRWILNVLRGVQGQGIVAFAILMGVTAGLLSAYVVWSSYRQRQPLRGLTLMAVVLALNGYYGSGSGTYLIAFIALMAGATALQHYSQRENEWVRNKIDYSEQIWVQLVVIVGVLSMILLFLSAVVPAIPVTAWMRAFQESTAVRETEATLERIFGGVQADAPPAAVPYPAATGLLPTLYLLGDAPELTETTIFEGQIFTAEGERADSTVGLHWRGATFDVYTGSGWLRSETETATFDQNERLPAPEIRAQQVITQEVTWITAAPLVNFYTLGRPRKVNAPVELSQWSSGAVARLTVPPSVRGAAGMRSYTAASQVSRATAAQLRQSRLEDVPPEIIEQYTQLPESLPLRVREMGQQLTADYDNPYDQARAIEAFLRQYPYNLRVPTPPRGVDPVDYFLFELQEGYCDYYASSMVVLARSVGLPARLAAGYLAQRPDENGVQTIVQKNGHSWAEVYFAGYGWIEFEPTAPFPLEAQAGGNDEGDPNLEDQDDVFPSTELSQLPAIPEQEVAQVQYWQWGLVLLPFVALGGYWLWQRRQRRVQQRDEVVWSFGRLQALAMRLGRPLEGGETVQEFGRGFVARLAHWAAADEGMRLRLRPVEKVVGRLVQLYELRQYAPPPTAVEQRQQDQEAYKLWRTVRYPLWRLRLRRWFRRENDREMGKNS